MTPARAAAGSVDGRRDPAGGEPLQVLITVDTEMWPDRRLDPAVAIPEALRRDVFGQTARGEFGIRYLMRTLDECGLRGVFFVEALCASVAGVPALEQVVREILRREHDVQLHLHPEWLRRGATPLEIAAPHASRVTRADETPGQHLHHFDLEGQRALLAEAIRNLEAAGAPRPVAFRAGSFGADRETLAALAALGIAFDSSHNAAWAAGPCALARDGWIAGPGAMGGVVEVPVTTFRDGAGRRRHVQVNGCSTLEMRSLLETAWRSGATTFVIVFHSFELLDAGRKRPDVLVVKRWESLCRHLAAHPTRYRTTTFRELAASPPRAAGLAQELRGTFAGWAARVAGQALRRVIR